jgi:hypothetical protein
LFCRSKVGKEETKNPLAALKWSQDAEEALDEDREALYGAKAILYGARRDGEHESAKRKDISRGVLKSFVRLMRKLKKEGVSK